MARSSASTSGGFSLAHSSRARRRIAIVHYSDGLNANRLSAERTAGPPNTAADAAPESSTARLRQPDDFSPLRSLLEATQPLTWVLAGDRLMDPTAKTPRWRSASEYWPDRLQTKLQRPHDLVVNVTQPGETAAGLQQRLEMLLLNLNADVVTLTVGLADAQSTAPDRPSFHHQLRQCIALVRDEGAVAILQTPHRVGRLQSSLRPVLAAYVQTIRDTARELNVPLVDHWKRWRRMERSGGHLRRWLDPDEMFPNARGHLALANWLCTKIAGPDRTNRSAEIR